MEEARSLEIVLPQLTTQEGNTCEEIKEDSSQTCTEFKGEKNNKQKTWRKAYSIGENIVQYSKGMFNERTKIELQHTSMERAL